MQEKEMQKLFKGIEKKIGKENYSKVADDIATIITDNKSMLDLDASKDEEIENLKHTNELLITANGSLLQQVGMGEDPKEKEKQQKENNKNYGQPGISLKDAFDERGNFKI